MLCLIVCGIVGLIFIHQPQLFIVSGANEKKFYLMFIINKILTIKYIVDSEK